MIGRGGKKKKEDRKAIISDLDFLSYVTKWESIRRLSPLLNTSTGTGGRRGKKKEKELVLLPSLLTIEKGKENKVSFAYELEVRGKKEKGGRGGKVFKTQYV